jgi:threonine aldolase
MELNFRSDNESPAAPAVMAALQEANQGGAWAYAEDRWSERLNPVFSELFETEVTVLPVSTGTVANSIALAAVSPPWGSVYCHRNAHILNDECGAPEFFGNGLRLVPMDGPEGRFDADALQRTIRASEGHGVHSYVSAAVSLTQSTESGTVYAPGQINDICSAATERGLATHLDGARFGNAVAALGCTPAETSWRAGIQMLSFGASKNGCMGAEALVLFNRNCELGGLDVAALGERAERLRKRSGHLLSKMRYVSAQLLAYVDDGLWLEMAGHANSQARRFADAVDRHSEASLEYPVEANEVFVRWSAAGFGQLEQAGVQFLSWPGRDDLARFVFSHCTDPRETDALCSALAADAG